MPNICKKCEEFSQIVKILHTFENRKIISNVIIGLAILARKLHKYKYSSNIDEH